MYYWSLPVKRAFRTPSRASWCTTESRAERYLTLSGIHATGSVDYFCMRRLLSFLRGALYAKAKLNTTGDDMLNETKPQTPFQEKISSLFEQSLTEEQRFLQGILRGEIQTFSHEEVVATLRETLKR